VLGQQRVEARTGGRDLPGVTELHEDGGDLGRTGAKDQALGLGQMHGHIHVVEALMPMLLALITLRLATLGAPRAVAASISMRFSPAGCGLAFSTAVRAAMSSGSAAPSLAVCALPGRQSGASSRAQRFSLARYAGTDDHRVLGGAGQGQWLGVAHHARSFH
jgi:hypothetical protein